MKIIFSIFLLFFLIVIFSCNKKSKTLTPTEKLCGKRWQLTACTIDPEITLDWVNYTTDYYALMLGPCIKDDYLEFTEDHKIVVYQNSLRCKPTYTNSYVSGLWEWDNTETKIIIHEYYYISFPSNFVDAGSSTWDVVQLNDNILRYRHDKDTTGYGFEYTYNSISK